MSHLHVTFTFSLTKANFTFFSDTGQHSPSDITLTLHLPLISAHHLCTVYRKNCSSIETFLLTYLLKKHLVSPCRQHQQSDGNSEANLLQNIAQH